MTAAAISSSGDYLAFGDADGNTHVWGTDQADLPGATFNGFEGLEPEWAEPVEAPAAVNWNADTLVALPSPPPHSAALLC